MHSRGAELVLFGQLNRPACLDLELLIYDLDMGLQSLRYTVYSIRAWLHVLKYVNGVVVSHEVNRVQDVFEIGKKRSRGDTFFTLML